MGLSLRRHETSHSLAGCPANPSGFSSPPPPGGRGDSCDSAPACRIPYATSFIVTDSQRRPAGRDDGAFSAATAATSPFEIVWIIGAVKDWIVRLDNILQMNGRELLTHAGKISHQMALEKSTQELEKYKEEKNRIAHERSLSELENDIKQIENKVSK